MRGAEAQVAGDQVAGLRTVLQEVAVTQVVVADVPLYPGVVGPVDRDAAVEAPPHAVAGEVLAVHRPHQMPVHRVPRHQSALPHESEGYPRDPERAAGPHEVTAVASRARGAVAPHHDVPGEEPDLRALIHRVTRDRLELSVVGERQGLFQRHGRPAHRSDRDDLRVAGFEIGRSDDQSVARSPAGRLRELELGRARRRGDGQTGPPLPSFAMQVERPARDAEHAVAHPHDVAIGRGAGKGDRRAMAER